MEILISSMVLKREEALANVMMMIPVFLIHVKMEGHAQFKKHMFALVQ